MSTVYVAVPILPYPKPPKRKIPGTRRARTRGLAGSPSSSRFPHRGWGALRSYDCRSLMLRAGGGNAHGTQAARKRSGQRTARTSGTQAIRPAAARQSVPAFPPAPAHPRQGECDPLSACEREGEAASLVDQVWRARSPVAAQRDPPHSRGHGVAQLPLLRLPRLGAVHHVVSALCECTHNHTVSHRTSRSRNTKRSNPQMNNSAPQTLVE